MLIHLLLHDEKIRICHDTKSMCPFEHHEVPSFPSAQKPMPLLA